jgi:hypothetical protein
VDNQITSKELKKMEMQQSPTRELRFYIKRKTCERRKEKEEKLSAS